MSDSARPDINKQRFVILDALRGIAAVCVMLHHAEQFYGHPGFFAHAYLAVDFFFMLSGFVINGVYAPRFGPDLSVSRFMVVRVKRLWPTLAIGVALGALLAFAEGPAPTRVLIDFIAGLTLTPILRGAAGLFILDDVEWSLFYELVANFIHRLGLWRLSNLRLLSLCGVCLVSLLTISMSCNGIGIGDRGSTFVAGFARLALPYLLGMYLQRVWQGGMWRFTVPAFIPHVVLPLSFCVAEYIGPRLDWIAEPLIVAFLFPIIIWFGACAKMPTRYQRLCLLGGALSYPLYTVHLPLIGAGDFIARGVTPLCGIFVRLFALAACIGGAWIIARYVEKVAVTQRA